LKIAAARALQKSMSKPLKLPAESTKPKPGTWLFTPQISLPRALIALSVSP